MILVVIVNPPQDSQPHTYKWTHTFNKILNNRPTHPNKVLVGPQLLDEKIQRFGCDELR